MLLLKNLEKLYTPTHIVPAGKTPEENLMFLKKVLFCFA
jgi:hypothetical protein